MPDQRTFRSVFTALSVFAFVVTCVVTLPACNTVDGAGEDLKQAADYTSEKIEEATD